MDSSRAGRLASTVETHVRNCLAKLGARNRAHAIALGLQSGEISLDLAAGPSLILGIDGAADGTEECLRDLSLP